MALLHAYFDESGTHAGAPATVVSGFIGTAEEWAAVRLKWEAALGGKAFHYRKMGGRSFTELREELADILATSTLQVVTGGFLGNWENVVWLGFDWQKRFPTPYHFVMELCISQMEVWAKEHWNDDPISLVFSRQKEYRKRAEEVWNTYRGNGLWPKFASFTYGDPDTLPELQTADMIAYETYQCIGKPGAWKNWPLVSRLLKGAIQPLGAHHDEDSFVRMLAKTDAEGRTYLAVC